MRNLKKILALVLAMVMTFSVMATANAFSDAEDIDATYDEATTVLAELGVFEGYEDGSFQPQGRITRAEVAAIIYRIVTGDVDDEQVSIYADYNKFADVKSTAWYAGYVNFCANAEYIKGYGDGNFGPSDKVTGYQALAMILRAVGYDKNGEFTGAGWQIQTAAVGKKLGVTDNVSEGTLGTAATREVVAELLYRAILVEQVTYTPALSYVLKDVSLGYETFGLTTTTGVVVENEMASLLADDADALSAGRTNIVFENEKGKNEYLTLAGSTGLDELGENTYFVYLASDSVKNRTVLYTADAGNTVYETSAYATEKNLTKAAKAAGIAEGKGTQEFVNYDEGNVAGNENGNYVKYIDNNDDGVADYILKAEYGMGIVTNVKDGEVTVNGDKYVAYEGAAKGDVAVVAFNDDDVLVAELAESFTGEVTYINLSKEYATIGGDDYYVSDIVYSEKLADEYYTDLLDASKDTEYTYYMDKFGYVRAYAEPVGTEDYILLTDAYVETNRSGKIYAAKYYDVESGEIVDKDVSTKYTANFIDTESGDDNDWGNLVDFDAYVGNNKETTITNIAAYTDGEVLKLADPQDFYYTAGGKNAGAVKVDYVGLISENGFEAGEKILDGVYFGEERDDADATNVYTNNSTVYYYVERGVDKKGNDYIKSIHTVTGRGNSYEVDEDGIYSAYALATNTKSDAEGAKYWVADIVVIETDYDVTRTSTDLVFAYYCDAKTAGDENDTATIKYIDSTGELQTAEIATYESECFLTADSFDDLYVSIPDVDFVIGFYVLYEEDGVNYLLRNDELVAEYAFGAYTDKTADLDDYFVGFGFGNGVTEGGLTMDYNADTNYYTADWADANRRGDILGLDVEADSLTKGHIYFGLVDNDGDIVWMIDLFTVIKDAVLAMGEEDYEEYVDKYAHSVADAHADGTHLMWTEAQLEALEEAYEGAVDEVKAATTAGALIKAAKAGYAAVGAIEPTEIGYSTWLLKNKAEDAFADEIIDSISGTVVTLKKDVKVENLELALVGEDNAKVEIYLHNAAVEGSADVTEMMKIKVTSECGLETKWYTIALPVEETPDSEQDNTTEGGDDTTTGGATVTDAEKAAIIELVNGMTGTQAHRVNDIGNKDMATWLAGVQSPIADALAAQYEGATLTGTAVLAENTISINWTVTYKGVEITFADQDVAVVG